MRLGARSYDVVIGSGLINRAGGLVKKVGRSVMVVSNRKVFGLYGKSLTESMDKAGIGWRKALLPDGERYKNISSVMKLHDRLIKGKYDRDAVIVALGGGVIGDIAGFAAASYMRGVRIIHIPTTVLSQVDSSVGGKTGVNHPLGKNMIGAFHQPSLVIADISALTTLPKKEILGGTAEVIKYGLIASARFFGFLERNIEKLVELEQDVVLKAVRRSIRIKADIVACDEKESGRRAILNFGHTAGHAIETVTGYLKYRHGYAVAIGMRVGAELSHLLGLIKRSELGRIIDITGRCGLPSAIPESIKKETILKAMRSDKKVKRGVIRFALLNSIGDCEIKNDIKHNQILEALERSYQK